MPPETSLLPPQKTPMGPTIGIIIILLLMGLGALYFWGARLNHENQNPPPYIPGDTIDLSATTTL